MCKLKIKCQQKSELPSLLGWLEESIKFKYWKQLNLNDFNSS